MNLSLERLLFDPATGDGQKVGSFIVGKSGEVVDTTDVGGVKGLNVNMLNEIDIRNLSAAQDNVAIHDADGHALDITADGKINALVSGSVGITDGTDALAINGDGSINAVVSASDLDIRNLSHAQDSVKVGDGTDFLAIDGLGRAEINDAANNTVDSTNVAVTATAVAIPKLANRVRVMIQNVGGESVYVGPADVSDTNGLLITKGASMALELGPDVDLYVVCATGKTSNVRVFEAA